jgi:hypothetical protein
MIASPPARFGADLFAVSHPQEKAISQAANGNLLVARKRTKI